MRPAWIQDTVYSIPRGARLAFGESEDHMTDVPGAFELIWAHMVIVPGAAIGVTEI